MVFAEDRTTDQRRYNAPRANEVAAVFIGDTDEPLDERQIVVYSWASGHQTKTIPYVDKNCDPMVYSLLFPLGDAGWCPSLKHVQSSGAGVARTVTILQFYAYRLAVRDQFSALHHAEKLFQQYFVDAYVKTEHSRLKWIRENQPKLRFECYQGLMDYIGSEAEQ